jgi:hypothetical protein
MMDWESYQLSLVFTTEATHALKLTGLSIGFGFGIFMCVFKILIALTVYTLCTRINYRIVPVTSLNKYLHYGTSGTE